MIEIQHTKEFSRAAHVVFFYAVHRKFMSLGVKGFTEEKEFHGVEIITT